MTDCQRPISSAGNQKISRHTAPNTIKFAIFQAHHPSSGKNKMNIEDRPISNGWHWTYGWLRRREEDRPYGYCYEDGDGDLIYTNNPRHRDKVYLECRQDAKTGEKYVCFASVSLSRDK